MKTTKVLATITVAGLLSFGAAGTAFAASSDPSGGSNPTSQPRAGAHGKGRYIRRAARRAAVKAAADAIGVTPQDLRAALRNGQSIAQFAQSKGVSTDTVVNAIVKAIDSKIDAAVSKGKLTSAQADKLKSRVQTLAEKLVNRVPRPRSGQQGNQVAGQPQT
jgi:ribosomal protein S20